MKARFEKLQADTIIIAGEVILEHKEEIIGLLVQQQFEEGIDSSGNPLREYSPAYKQHKILSGKSGKTDLENTGEYHETMNLTVVDDEMFINSPAMTDNGILKTDWLNAWNEARGGSEVNRLSPENLALVWPIIEADFKARVNEELAYD